MSAPTVADYIMDRLADLGIGHVFGVPGDYAFPIDNAIESNRRLSWVLCSNELNAAYSADGYARMKGAAILTTTYNVGEASALCGVLGARAERLPVFHVVGAPSTRLARTRRPMHHSFGDGALEPFRAVSAVSVCASAFLTPQNAIAEMERVIGEALSQRQPAYIQIPEDYAMMPVVGEPIRGVPLEHAPTFASNPRELEAAVSAILARLADAKAPVILAAYTIARYGLRRDLEAFLEASGIPFAVSSIEKGLISESNPLFAGVYSGDYPPESAGVRTLVEGADLVLNLGGMRLSDFAAGYGDRIQATRMLTVWPDHVELGALGDAGGQGPATFGPVHFKDVLMELAKRTPKFDRPFQRPAAKPPFGAPGERVTNASIYSRIQQFLEREDILFVAPGTCAATGALPTVLLPDGADFHSQILWACVGWAAPAAFGAALAAPSRRVILVDGDGGHQFSASQIGTMGKYGVNPIILVLNNGLFGVEEVLQGNSNPEDIHVYDKIPAWKYHLLPEAMGCRDWFCASVATNEELDSALATARKRPGAAYIEIVLTGTPMPPAMPAASIDRLYQVATPEG
jgi:indolepyruvate decarboxylase